MILLPLHKYHPPLRISRASAARWFYSPAPAQGDKGTPGGGGQEGNFQAPSRQPATLLLFYYTCAQPRNRWGPEPEGVCSAELLAQGPGGQLGRAEHANGAGRCRGAETARGERAAASEPARR